jgi:3-hydroxyacyl-[acyl-carrier-protein] dehydratase
MPWLRRRSQSSRKFAMKAPLPHAYPFVLLDRIVELRDGVAAIAVRCVTLNDPLAAADGCLPTLLLAEALAQCAGVAVLGGRPGAGAIVARIDRFRSRVPARAGAELRVTARVVRIFGTTAKVRGVVHADGRRCAAGEVVLQMRGGARHAR